MDDYVEFQRFSSVELASDLIDVLEKNDILFQVDDSALRFQLVSSVNSQFNQVIVKIKEQDLEKANSLIVANIDESHYLFTFSDKDIIDVVANPSDWTNEEQTIAKQIIKTRRITVTAEDIRQARIEKIETDNTETAQKSVNKSYSWFLRDNWSPFNFEYNNNFM